MRKMVEAIVGTPVRCGFPRSLKLGLEEAELVRRALRSVGVKSGVLVDVGAHVGTVTARFVPHGWEVHAFEPDPLNRRRFRERFDGCPGVYLSDRAVTESDDQYLDFFASEVSTGISGLVSFHESHRVVTQVETVRLDTYLSRVGRPTVDFIKVDTEGYDLFVLRSYDWSSARRPAAVLCEYEDAKTQLVGYSTQELADFLVGHGYTVLFSEWHPIEEYGRVHAWRRIRPWTATSQPSADSWGNLVAFLDPEAADAARKLLPTVIERGESPSLLAAAMFDAWRRFSSASLQI